MLRCIRSLSVVLVAGGLAGVAGAADVAVSVQVGQPGFYGRIDIGNAPAPRVVLAEPVWVQRGPVRPAPIYLRVPPGHQKKWSKHCARYQACGQPVYFVDEAWYAERYGVRDERGHGHGHGRGKHRD